MSRVLITGMSGTGKSSVLGILRWRGYDVVDTDAPGWCVPEDGDWSTPDSTWIWDGAKITSLLDKPNVAHLFVAGCRVNQGQFYDRFEQVVLLTSPLAVILERVTNRTNNPFGSSPSQREQIAHDKQTFEPMLIRGADVVIDTSITTPERLPKS